MGDVAVVLEAGDVALDGVEAEGVGGDSAEQLSNLTPEIYQSARKDTQQLAKDTLTDITLAPARRLADREAEGYE